MNLEEQYHAEGMLRKIERVEAERDNAWTELREIRAAISANQEESTLDEVVKLRQQLAEAQADAIEQARIVGMGGEREIDLRQHVALLRDALEEVTALARNLLSDAEQQVVEEYTEATKVFKICDAAIAATDG